MEKVGYVLSGKIRKKEGWSLGYYIRIGDKIPTFYARKTKAGSGAQKELLKRQHGP